MTHYGAPMHPDHGTEHTNDSHSAEPRSTRRRLLRLAGAATVGAAGASALAGRAVAETGYATVGGSYSVTDSVSQVQTAGRPGESAFVFATVGIAPGGNGSIYPSALAGWSVSSDNPHGVYGYTSQQEGFGVIGYNDSTAEDDDGAGVAGRGYVGVSGASTVPNGIGVLAVADTGYGVAARGGSGAIIMASFSSTAPPQRAGSWRRGTLDVDSGGSIWFCVETGTPGKWRQLAGPTTAGAFHPLTPGRVYDSRQALPLQGVLASPATRTISVADRRNPTGGAVVQADFVPAGAIAVAANITVISVAGRGFLTVNPGGVTTADASTINWFAAGQNLANGVILSLNTNRELTVVAGGAGASTNFIVDITGYWL